MNIRLTPTPLCLAKNQMLALDAAKGSLVACRRGGLWVTQDDDLRDIVLLPGESFTLDRDGAAMVSALADSTLDLRPAPSAGQPLAALWRRLAQAARALAGGRWAPSVLTKAT